MAITHNLGFPRIGAQRELKYACEDYWQGLGDTQTFLQQAHALRDGNSQLQLSAGLDYLPCGDFALYDHVLSTSFLFGNVPQRFRDDANRDVPELDQYFRVARGKSRTGTATFASEMTKWFDTNYHYIVPEFDECTAFSLHADGLLNDILAAKNLAAAGERQTKPVLLGPLTYLWLGKAKSTSLNKLDLLKELLPVYHELLVLLQAHNIEWVQIDEPILALDLPEDWLECFEPSYHRLQVKGLNVLLATYFGDLGSRLATVARLPVAGIHIDAVRGRADVNRLLDHLSAHKILSLGVIDGRNIWKSDLNAILDWLEPVHAQLQDRLWLAPSCSLLHVPIDLNSESDLDPELKSWLAFARQKLAELHLLKSALNRGRRSVRASLSANQQVIEARRRSPRVHSAAVQARVTAVGARDFERDAPYSTRVSLQQEALHLPPLATTTIGSFPQTQNIRQARAALRTGAITAAQYQQDIQQHIRYAVREQEEIGLDVLVHGEAERNDMVEYFAEQLEGYAFTRFGWVQSYGSRCVKPPIIFGDVHRPRAMTVDWAVYAQSLTSKPVKGMLTGPLTLLQWAFVRDDQPRQATAIQIALALRDEVADLERSGIGIIQVDEPAFREGLPLQRAHWHSYLTWAVQAFRLATCGVNAQTQIHTHMCYSEFNDIIESIALLDADVITIETSRSDMKLLNAFTEFEYPNEIGPGVYDIHSPNLPSQQQMVSLIKKAAQSIPVERLWVNPDCGLKTRQWEEVRPALTAMVAAAQELRQTLLNKRSAIA